MEPAATRNRFTWQLINDLKALERLLAEDHFERDTVRIGAEQELCLMDYSLRPAMLAMPVLQQLQDEHFTTELAQFNLEANLDPLRLEGGCFSKMEQELIRLLTKANKEAHALGGKIILTGILPTIRKRDIVLENMTPVPRYRMLNDAILKARTKDFKFHISGLDELIARHDNVLFEACNTSFQIHYQVDPDRAIAHFNWAHAIAGPVLAAATNSPIFLGKRLWHETRIALFTQSADTRRSFSPLRSERPRVFFGQDWQYQTPLELFQNTVARHKILLPLPLEEDALEVLDRGEYPKLRALALHNGTIYPWIRMCYGLTDGKPHLRIENRYLPSGPTIADEVANMVFWTGLMHGMHGSYGRIHEKMDFDEAKNNFFTAAKVGLKAQFYWLNHQIIPARTLILEELLPLSRQGLEAARVDSADIDKYLGIIAERVASNRTGSYWILESYNRLKKTSTPDEAVVSLTEGIYQRQKSGNPVHTWTDLRIEEGGGWENRFRHVDQVMTRDLITVHKDDLVELARNIMLWSKIHHLPVENHKGKLVGLLTSDRLLSLLDRERLTEMAVGEVMLKEVITIDPHATTVEAYHLMKKHGIGCLPVVDDQKLVGILTLNDFVQLMGFFFNEMERNDTT